MVLNTLIKSGKYVFIHMPMNNMSMPPGDGITLLYKKRLKSTSQSPLFEEKQQVGGMQPEF